MHTVRLLFFPATKFKFLAKICVQQFYVNLQQFLFSTFFSKIAHLFLVFVYFTSFLFFSSKKKNPTKYIHNNRFIVFLCSSMIIFYFVETLYHAPCTGDANSRMLFEKCTSFLSSDKDYNCLGLRVRFLLSISRAYLSSTLKKRKIREQRGIQVFFFFEKLRMDYSRFFFPR